MKKSNLIIAAAALVMASCAQNEVLFQDFKEVAIDFQSQGIEKNTKAELTMDWFKTINNSFGVNGYKDSETKIFSNEKVYSVATYSSSDAGYWKHDNVRFWDKTVNSYAFYAYAPYTASGDVTFNKTTGYTFSNLNLFDNIASSDCDKAIAFIEGVGYSNGSLCTDSHENAPTVPFIFNHVLSKLSFKVKTTVASSDAVIYLKSISAQFPTATANWAQSSVNVASGTATFSSYTKAKLVAHTASGNAIASGDAAGCTDGIYTTQQASGDALSATAAAYGNTYIVVPVNGTQTEHEFAISVVYDIEYNDGTVESGAKALGAISYAPNSNDYYVVTINVDPAKIEFCVDNVESWVEKDASMDVQ